MVYHILNGDALGHSFPEAKIQGKIIIFREALMAGDISAATMPEFWEARARYMKRGHDEYTSVVLSEIEKINAAQEGDEFNLWFEYDLFCQVNMWFVLSMLQQLPVKIKAFAVYTTHVKPSDKLFWNGFSGATPDTLRSCFSSRVELQKTDIALGASLWQAYRSNDLATLSKLSQKTSQAFPFIEPVIAAHADTGRPERVIEEILNSGVSGFENVFAAFWQEHSLYGFGDMQLKAVYDKVIAQRKANRAEQ